MPTLKTSVAWFGHSATWCSLSAALIGCFHYKADSLRQYLKVGLWPSAVYWTALLLSALANFHGPPCEWVLPTVIVKKSKIKWSVKLLSRYGQLDWIRCTATFAWSVFAVSTERETSNAQLNACVCAKINFDNALPRVSHSGRILFNY